MQKYKKRIEQRIEKEAQQQEIRAQEIDSDTPHFYRKLL